MKYGAHYSKIAAMENAAENAHNLPIINDVACKVPSQKPVNKSIVSAYPSDDKMANIIGYIHGHNNTQLVTLSSTAVGIGALENMKKKLDLAGDELLRIEDESGTPLSAEQTAKVDSYFRESQHIGNALQTAKNKPVTRIRTGGDGDNH